MRGGASSKKKKGWGKLALGLCVPFAVAVAWFGDDIPSIPRLNEERKVVKHLKRYEIEFKRENFKGYYELGCNTPWRVCRFVQAGINTDILEALVNDPEIIGKVREKYNGDDKGKLRRKLVDKVGGLMWGLNYSVDWNYYVSMRSEDKGGFFSMLSAEGYGIPLEDLLKIPDPNKEDFDLLEKQRVPVDYSVKGLQQGKKVEDIIEGYSKEVAGVTNEVREQYWKNKGTANLNNSQIKIFDANGITPGYFRVIAREGNRAVNSAIRLIQQGKFNGKICDEWIPEVSVNEMFFGIQHGYSPEDAKKANALGRTLMQYHTDLQYHDLLKSGPRNATSQPILNGAPR